MPVFPPIPQAPYPVWNQILNTARLRLLDMIQTPAGASTGVPALLFDQVGGDLLDNTDPQTQVVANAAWTNLLVELANLGDTLCIGDEIIRNLPVVANLDPGSKCWMDWTGFFDGQQFWPSPPGTAALPMNFISPLFVGERPSNGFTPYFQPVFDASDGLQPRIKIPRNGQFEWRKNKLWIPGATGPVDLRIRFIENIAQFQDVGDVPWYNQPVPVPDCTNALAWFIVYEFSGARGDIDRDSCLAQAQKYTGLIYNRQARRNQQTNTRRMPRSGNRQASGGTTGLW